MASDVSYDWPYDRPKRWRRWVARLFALLALAACGVGVWVIVREATIDHPPAPATLSPQLHQLAASGETLAVRLEALRPGDSTSKAQAAAREVRADQAAAVVALRAARARKAGVRADGQLGNALDAEGTYLATVTRVLRHPRSRVASELTAQAKAARDGFDALPDAGGVTDTIRGARRLTAYARAARG